MLSALHAAHACCGPWLAPLPVHRASVLAARRSLHVRAAAVPALAPQVSHYFITTPGLILWLGNMRLF